MPTIGQFKKAFSCFDTEISDLWGISPEGEKELWALLNPFLAEFKILYGFDIREAEKAPEEFKDVEITGELLKLLEPLIEAMNKIGTLNYFAMCGMQGESDVMKGWIRTF